MKNAALPRDSEPIKLLETPRPLSVHILIKIVRFWQEICRYTKFPYGGSLMTNASISRDLTRTVRCFLDLMVVMNT